MLAEGTVGIEFDAAGSDLWQSTWFEEGKKTFIDVDSTYGASVGAAMDCVRTKTS
jgi:hypothetical protein